MPNDNRAFDELRPIMITADFVPSAYGSCLITCGGTRVICTASVEDSVPPFLRGRGKGWLTAEYAMLPASTGKRKARDGVKRDGRGVEISRLIGRALRQAVDLGRLGERTITLDCDVLTADGGTRTASITGAYVALALAVRRLLSEGKLPQSPIKTQVAAVSVGIVDGAPCLDLDYARDSRAGTDMNVVMNGEGAFIELQGTGEGSAFTRAELDTLIALAESGIRQLMDAQRAAVDELSALIQPRRKLLIATDNAHKIAEMRRMLPDAFDIVSLAEVGVVSACEENSDTFEGNAIIKAREGCEKSGLLTIADDSGLCVDALGGAPGVHSARYAGVHGDSAANNALLQRQIKEFPDPVTAHFACAMALCAPGCAPVTVRGDCPGVIVRESRGASGFGYDPYFLYENGLTFAQMSADEKNAVSHRARAAALMCDVLKPFIS